MPTVVYRPAERFGTKIILTAYGFSGCGKTYSLIRIGRGLVGAKGKLGMLDTENERGRMYASMGYDYAELTPPHTPERYIEAIEDAEASKLDALIIDSGSHEWEGMGGILEIAEMQTSRSGAALEGLVKWAKPKARHKKYVQCLLNSRMHILISLRAKEKMVQGKNPDTGREEIFSAGYQAISERRFIFETTVQLFLPLQTDRKLLGVPIIEKCPEDLWPAFPENTQISEKTGEMIAEWIRGGTPVDEDARKLRLTAEEFAAQGTKSLRIYWRALTKQQQDQLRPFAGNLGSIAKTADEEIASGALEQQDEEEGAGAERRLAAEGASAEPDLRERVARNRAISRSAPANERPGESDQPLGEREKPAQSESPPQTLPDGSTLPYIPEIVPAKIGGIYDWNQYADLIIERYRITKPNQRAAFRENQQQFMGLLHSAAPEIWDHVADRLEALDRS